MIIDILPDEVNTSRITRPSGLVAPSTRWRKAWKCYAPAAFIEKVLTFDRDIRFGVYADLDSQVNVEYMKLLKQNSASESKVDIDELMLLAGEFTANKLN